MTFLVYCTNDYYYVSDSTIKSVFPDSEFNNEPIYESVKMYVVSNVSTAEQAKDIITYETNLQVVKVEELSND